MSQRPTRIDSVEYKKLRKKLLAEVSKRPAAQDDIAKEIGIFPATLQKLLQGHENINHFTMYKLADFFTKDD